MSFARYSQISCIADASAGEDLGGYLGVGMRDHKQGSKKGEASSTTTLTTVGWDKDYAG